MNRNVLLIYLSIMCVLECFGQVPAWKQVDVPSDQPFKKILTDTFGFVWALDNTALYRYDGFEFLSVLSTKEDSLKITTISELGNDRFILGTDSGQVLEFDPISKKVLREIQNVGMIISTINCSESGDSCVFISYGNGVHIETNTLDTFINSDNLLNSNEVYDAAFIKDQIFLASDQGIQILSLEGNQIFSKEMDEKDGLIDVVITQIFQFNNQVWVSDFHSGIQNLTDKGHLTNYYLPERSSINDILINDLGTFVATSDGLYYLNNNSFSQIYPETGSTNVESIVMDKLGNLWLSDNKNPLVFGNLVLQKFGSYNSQIQALNVQENETWLGCANGLYKNLISLENRFLNANITSIKEDITKNLWIGTFSNGFYILDSLGAVKYHLSGWNGFENQSVLNIYTIKDHAYISTLTGITRFNYTGDKEDYKVSAPQMLNEQLGEGYVYDILEKDEKLYFGTDRQGIKILSDTGLKEIERFENGNKIGSVYSMTFDDENGLWFTSSNGGVGFKANGKVKVLQTSVNSNEYYSSIINLKDENLILIRKDGIDILDSETHKMVSESGELFNSELESFLNAFDVKNSKVYFANGDNLLSYNFDPKYFSYPDAIIDQVLVNLVDTDKHSLDQDQNSIQFRLASSWITKAEELNFKYRLDGFDNEWRTTGDRIISYPNLSPGVYTFLVSASLNHFTGNEQISKYTFQITRYFYNTWWFWSFITLIVLGLTFYLITLRRKQQIRQLEISRKHIESQLANLKSQLNPHFLFNSFNTLVGMIEEENKTKSLGFVEDLTDFYRLVLEHGKEQLVLFSEELKLVKLYIEILNARFEDAIDLKLQPDEIKSMIPPLTLQLLIENAVKHNKVGPNHNLSVKIEQHDDYIIVKNKKEAKHYPSVSSGSGLNNIKKRYLLLNPKPIQVLESDDDFEVRLPIINIEHDVNNYKIQI